MTRHITLFITLILSLPVFASEHLPVDTLLNTQTAGNISIESTTGFTSIVVSKLSGGSENFYYQTGSRRSEWMKAKSRIECPDVRNVTVCEGDSAVSVSFATPGSEMKSYTFPFADPANRTTKSYIGSKGSEFGFNISRKGAVSWDCISSGLSLGWINTLNAVPDFDASMWKSNELSWLVVLGVSMNYRSTSVTSGLGIRWQNFVTKGDHYFKKNEDGRISLAAYGEGTTHHRSRIKVFSLQIPLLYGVSFGRHRNLLMNFGPILNFNTGGSIKTQYHDGNEEYSIKTRKIGQRPVTVDLYGVVRFKSVGWYVRYSPMNVLSDKTGLEFNSVSTGLAIGL